MDPQPDLTGLRFDEFAVHQLELSSAGYLIGAIRRHQRRSSRLTGLLIIGSGAEPAAGCSGAVPTPVLLPGAQCVTTAASPPGRPGTMATDAEDLLDETCSCDNSSVIVVGVHRQG